MGCLIDDHISPQWGVEGEQPGCLLPWESIFPSSMREDAQVPLYGAWMHERLNPICRLLSAFPLASPRVLVMPFYHHSILLTQILAIRRAVLILRRVSMRGIPGWPMGCHNTAAAQVSSLSSGIILAHTELSQTRQ